MALHRFRPILLAAAVAAVATFLLVGCSDRDEDDDDSTPTPTAQPATPTPSVTEPVRTPTIVPGTTTPTPEANSIPGFIAALTQLSKELNAGTVDPLISRFKVVDYTCKPADLQPGLGQPDCKVVGETFRGFLTSSWRSEGGLRRVEDTVANLKGYQASFDPTKSDVYGPGTFRVYAYDPTKTTAVITVTSKCLPQFQCPTSGFQRLVWVPTFEYIDGRWKIASLMYAFVLGEEFLDPPSAEVKQRMPQWTKLP